MSIPNAQQHPPEINPLNPKPHGLPDQDSWRESDFPVHEVTKGAPLFRVDYRVDRDKNHVPPRLNFSEDPRMQHRFTYPRWRGGEDPYTVLYASIDYFGCMRETVLSVTGEIRHISQELADSRRRLRFSCKKNLILVDITGPGLAWIGADARLGCGGDRRISQEWSLAFWETQWVDGVYYRSRLDPSRLCVALYSDRVQEVDLQLEEAVEGLTNLPEWREVLGEYRFEFGVPQPDVSYRDVKISPP